MTTLTTEVLTREAFRPFGDVIELEHATHFPINDGTTERYHDLASVDVGEQGGYPLINVFRAQPRQLPFEVKMMERHPLGSQAFIPISDRPYVVLVAPNDELRLRGLRAFVTRGWQGVNYARGVWHHPLIALSSVSDFLVVDRGGEGRNLEEAWLLESVWLTEQAVLPASVNPSKPGAQRGP
jgi:ureidoglycolate lyase